ncbi:MAG: hypothetical protein JST26_05490 [Bacteroidetes bacterium]|nr:hypothetical protein [Bacteroidota bacterium]
MKTLITWIALIAMSCMASSQSLTPKILLQGQDTLFCFNMGQSKTIAHNLLQGRYCDSLLQATELQNQQACDLQAASDSSIQILKTKVSNQGVIMLNDQKQITELKLNLEQKDKNFKNQRLQKGLFMGLSLILGTCLILKQ